MSVFGRKLGRRIHFQTDPFTGWFHSSEELLRTGLQENHLYFLFCRLLQSSRTSVRHLQSWLMAKTMIAHVSQTAEQMLQPWLNIRNSSPNDLQDPINSPIDCGCLRLCEALLHLRHVARWYTIANQAPQRLEEDIDYFEYMIQLSDVIST